MTPLFGLAPGGVCRAIECCHRRGALLPHPFTLAVAPCGALGRFAFCCTFRGLAPPRRYLAPRPVEPGLSSVFTRKTAIVWLTPEDTICARGAQSQPNPNRESSNGESVAMSGASVRAIRVFGGLPANIGRPGLPDLSVAGHPWERWGGRGAGPFWEREKQDVFLAAYRDVFTAVPKGPRPSTALLPQLS